MGRFDLLALGVQRKDLALRIARLATSGQPIPEEDAEAFREIDATFRAEQYRLNVEANKPRPRSRY